MNQFVSFYKKNSISPVKQDISDFDSHIMRRKSLYRELGLVSNSFNNADILEIGPGSGHNSIVTALYNSNSYILVEPNETGFNDMIKLFKKQKINLDNIQFINDYAESLKSDTTFDIVLCEGLLSGLDNKADLLSTLKSKVKLGGVLVITTVDEISIFLDIVRRFIGNLLTIGVESFEKKVDLLSIAFESHLKQLAVSSRPIKDWVADVLINPASSKSKDYFSVEDAIHYFGDEFYYYNASPNIFINSVWYKSMKQNCKDYNENYLSQFLEKRHTLLLQNMGVYTRNAKNNENLLIECSKFININADIENGIDVERCKLDAIKCMETIKSNLDTDDINNIFDEIIEILHKPSIVLLNESKYFASSFGKGQQYISFVKE